MRHLNSSWQERRDKFNHDWLKNKYMPALGTFLNLLDDEIKDVEFERSFISEILPQWELHRDEAFALPKDFEEKMSPKALFDYIPLSRLENETKEWLSKLVHALWLTRHPIKQWMFDATASAYEVDAEYILLKKKLREFEDLQSTQALKTMRGEFVTFRKQCQNLARAIEKFPSEVKGI